MITDKVRKLHRAWLDSKRSLAWRKALSDRNRAGAGRIASDETRQAISKALRGKPKPPGFGHALSELYKGKRPVVISPTAEWIAKQLGDCAQLEYTICTGHQSGREGPTYYNIDVAVPTIRLAIEVDGRKTWRRQERAKRRDEFLKSIGWTVIRIPNMH